MSYGDLARLVTFRPLERPLECGNRTSPFLAHPDHGGSPDDFRDVIAYRDRQRD